MATNEVRNGDFVYRDTFFADPGGDKRHPRASPVELKNFLLPKKGTGPPQDQVGHWYEAQLLHYGLPRTKDKNTAKVRLMSAITAGTLTVPAHIISLETSMKREFDAMSRRTKAAAAKKAQGANPSDTPSYNDKKRKAEPLNDTKGGASRTKISVSVGNVTFDIDHDENTPNEPKKRKTASAPKTKQTAAKSTGTPTSKRSSAGDAASRNDSQGAADAAAPHSLALSSPPDNRRHNSSRNTNHYDYDIYAFNEPPPPYESHDFSRTHETNESHTRTHTVRLQASGTYSIYSTTYDDADCKLTITKDTRTGQFWARFLVASHEGVFNIPDPTGMANQQMVYFNWRAQDLESGQLLFRRDQDGWVQFDGRGGIRGCWNGLLLSAGGGGGGGPEDIEFEGELRDGESDVEEVDELIDQWEWYPKAAYGRRRRRRSA